MRIFENEVVIFGENKVVILREKNRNVTRINQYFEGKNEKLSVFLSVVLTVNHE